MRGVISKELMPRLLFMFALGGIQGFLGWYMVSSGLTENVRVSHIRLAIHLTFAFITFGYIFWVALTQLFPVKYSNTYAYTRYKKYGWTLLSLVILQVIYGAFVAGTKAGLVYTTWPMMEGEWVPESITYMLKKDGIGSLINNLASVQFIHRSLAYLITVIVIMLIVKVWKDKQLEAGQKKSAYLLGGLIVVQIVLGVYTLLNSVPVALGVIHQATAFFVFATTIYFIYRLAYASMKEKIVFVDEE
jgi:cytochrome c oxidase assembly protein subunit 15